MKLTQMALDFHTAMDVPVLKKPTIPNKERCRLRQDLVTEECSELCRAIDKRNLVEIADGIADLLYVTIGTALEFGLTECLGDIITEVHRSNMSKLVDGKPIKREDGKVLKPDTYSPADLAPIIKRFLDSTQE